jgi:hypothetical protein
LKTPIRRMEDADQSEREAVDDCLQWVGCGQQDELAQGLLPLQTGQST